MLSGSLVRGREACNACRLHFVYRVQFTVPPGGRLVLHRLFACRCLQKLSAWLLQCDETSWQMLRPRHGLGELSKLEACRAVF